MRHTGIILTIVDDQLGIETNRLNLIVRLTTGQWRSCKRHKIVSMKTNVDSEIRFYLAIG